MLNNVICLQNDSYSKTNIIKCEEETIAFLLILFSVKRPPKYQQMRMSSFGNTNYSL